MIFKINEPKKTDDNRRSSLDLKHDQIPQNIGNNPWNKISWGLKIAIVRTGDFKGRSSRQEFWAYFIPFAFILSVVLSIDNLVFATIFLLATLVTNLSLGVRRLHDIGKSGWWIILLNIAVNATQRILISNVVFIFLDGYLVLVFGLFIINLVSFLPWLLIRKGDETTNKYDASPIN